METITAEQAETEAAQNWCAGLLAGAGSRIEGDVAKRWVAIGVGTLHGFYKDVDMSDEDKKRKCDEAYRKSVEHDGHPYPSLCVVDGVEYGACQTCPLWRGQA